MSKRIAFVGAGALGGYVGSYLAHNGHDVTLIDMWPEHIEAIRARGMQLDGVTDEECFTVKAAKTMHLTEVQSLAKQKPIDIAFVSVKSYDTEWATMLIKPYLAPGGFVVSLQNCLNEEKIAGVVGWGKTLGIVASLISVELYEPGRIRRMVPKGGKEHTVFRVGEVHGIVTPRVEELVAMLSQIDSRPRRQGSRLAPPWSSSNPHIMQFERSVVAGLLRQSSASRAMSCSSSSRISA
jgi:2-dehydropantoate 2-reductase